MFVQPYQDCQDVVKEVPYLAPEERCEKVGLAWFSQSQTLVLQVPHENCEEVEERVPVEVCTSVDLTRQDFSSYILIHSIQTGNQSFQSQHMEG